MVKNKAIAVTKQEAVRLTGISRAQLDKAVSQGKLRRRKLGVRVLFMVSDLEKFIFDLPDPDDPLRLDDPRTLGKTTDA